MYDPFANPPMYPGSNPTTLPAQNPGAPVGPVPQPGAQHPHGPSHNNAFAGLMGPFGAQWQGYRTAMTDWRGQRPDMQGFAPVSGGPQDFRTALMDWRQQRPTFRSYLPGSPTGAMTTNPNAGI